MENAIDLFSSHSMRISLASISNGNGGLDEHRESLLRRVPETGDWAKFPYGHLAMKDLAYLTAKTSHEFAILRGKREDILFHGNSVRCHFDSILVDMLYSGKLMIFGHSHPGEIVPIASHEDRETLRLIGQRESHLISGYSGIEITFTENPFEIV